MANEMHDEIESEDFSRAKISDEDRMKAISALGKIATTESSGAFVPKERKDLGRVKNAIMKALDDNGYDTKNPACHLALSSFIDNLGRAFPPESKRK